MKTFHWIDKSGRGFSGLITTDDLLAMDNDIDLDEMPLHEFAQEAEEGDTWEDHANRFTCVEI